MANGIFNLDFGSILKGAGSLVESIGTAIRGKQPVDEAKLMELGITLKTLENVIPTLLSKVDEAQAAINAEEAKSTSFFKNGARPMALWVCVVAFACNYVIMPTIAWILNFFMTNVPALIAFDSGELMTLLFGLLGLTAARSYDKMLAAKK